MSKTVLVTGGNAGIGLALSRQLAADHGCRVLMASRNAQRGEDAIKSLSIPAGRGSVQLVVMDVSDDASVAEAADKVKQMLGGDMLYGVVNNAGK